MSTPQIPTCLKGTVAVLKISTYDQWLQFVGKKTRCMVSKAKRVGVLVQKVSVSKTLACGIWKIYNEAPIRQNRAFKYYGIDLATVEALVLKSPNTFLGAYFQGELIGFMNLQVIGDTVNIEQILSLTKHWDKAVNNALLSEAVRFCADNGFKWLIYARFGNHPSLDQFKRNNGFREFDSGRFAWDSIIPFKNIVIPIHNWVNRRLWGKERVKAWKA